MTATFQACSLADPTCGLVKVAVFALVRFGGLHQQPVIELWRVPLRLENEHLETGMPLVVERVRTHIAWRWRKSLPHGIGLRSIRYYISVFGQMAPPASVCLTGMATASRSVATA